MTLQAMGYKPQGLEVRRGRAHPLGMIPDFIPPKDLRGRVLIAMPGLGDPRFERSVIFICAHSADGAMGLVLNRILGDVRFADLIAQIGLEPDATPPDLPVHFGGPVEPGRGFVLHSADYASDTGTMAVTETIGMSATIDVLAAIAAGTGPRAALVALGYAGWGPGQLEAEVQDNGWLIGDCCDELVFGADHGLKWQTAIRSLGIDPVMLSASGGRA